MTYFIYVCVPHSIERERVHTFCTLQKACLLASIPGVNKMLEGNGHSNLQTISGDLSPTGYNNAQHGITMESTAHLVAKDTEHGIEEMNEEHTCLTDRSIPTQEEELFDVSMTLGIPVSNTYSKSRETCYGMYLRCILNNAYVVLLIYTILLIAFTIAYYVVTKHKDKEGTLYSFGRISTDSNSYSARRVLVSSKFEVNPCSLSRTVTLYIFTKSNTQIEHSWPEVRNIMQSVTDLAQSAFNFGIKNSSICGVHGPLSGNVNFPFPTLQPAVITKDQRRFLSANGQAVYSHIALHGAETDIQEEHIYKTLKGHMANLTRHSNSLSVTFVRPNSLRTVIMQEMGVSLQSASILMALMLPVVLAYSLRDIKLVLVTSLSISWTILLSVMTNEVLLHNADRVCFSKILNVYFSVVASTLVATFLSSKFKQLQSMIATRRFHDRWKIRVDPSFLTIYPHFDLAYNSTCTIVMCSVSIWFAGKFTDNVALMSSGETVALTMMSVVSSLAHIHPALLKLAERRLVEYEFVDEEDNDEKVMEENENPHGESIANEPEESAVTPLTMEVGGTHCSDVESEDSNALVTTSMTTLQIHRRLKMLMFFCAFFICIGLLITTPSMSKSIALRHYMLVNPDQQQIHDTESQSPTYQIYKRFISDFGPGPLYPVQLITSTHMHNRTLLTPDKWKALQQVAIKAKTTSPIHLGASGTNVAWMSNTAKIPVPLEIIQHYTQKIKKGDAKSHDSTILPLIPGVPRNQSKSVVGYLKARSLSLDGSVAITDISLAYSKETKKQSDPIGIVAGSWYQRYSEYANSDPKGSQSMDIVHYMRGIPIEAYEMVHRMYETLFYTKLAVALPLFVAHVVFYKSACIAISFHVAYFMSASLSHALAHAILQQGIMQFVPIVSLSVGAGAGEEAVQWCIPLFADVSVLLVTTLYVNTHVLNRCKQIIQHGHHFTTVPIVRAMARLTLQLVCIMAVSLVAAKQPVMNQLLQNYIIVMLSAFVAVYCGVLPLLDCLPPAALAWPYGSDYFALN